MLILEQKFDRAHIVVEKDQLLILNAALNEITNGIDVFEFETRIGATREKVLAMLNEIGSLLDGMG